MNITELICQGECETTEFKTSLAEWRDVYPVDIEFYIDVCGAGESWMMLVGK